jgi:hypothetical protein
LTTTVASFGDGDPVTLIFPMQLVRLLTAGPLAAGAPPPFKFYI